MAVVVAEGVVVVKADGKEIPHQIADDIEAGSGAMESAGAGVGRKIFGGIIGAYAAIGGTQAIFGYFKDSILGASDLNETLSKSETIFGANAKSIEKWGDTAATTVGMSKEAAIAAAAGFGDMFTQIGFTDDAAANMSKSVVQAAADLGSFSNLDTADVTERISAAFRGEYDSLQAVIPNINAARVEKEAMAATGKKLASELSAEEKASAVLAIVQTDGARAMGDFAKTSEGAANAAKIATASLEDQNAKLGGVLLPAWTGFLSFLNTSAIPAFGTVVEWITQNTDVLKGLGMAVGVAAGTFVALKTGLALYNGVSAIFKAYQIASAAATGGLTVAQWALNAAMAANPIGLIVTALSLLVGGIVWVATQTTFFQDAWSVMTDIIGTAWNWLWSSVLEPVFNAIGTAITWLTDSVFAPIGSFITGVVEAIGTAWDWLYNTIIMPVVIGIMLYIGLWAALFQWLWESAISPIITWIGEGIAWLGTNVFAPLGSFVQTVFDGIGAVFNWIWSSVIQPIIGYVQLSIQGWGMIFQWLYGSIIQPVFAAVGASFNWVWGSVISPIVGWISGAIRNVGNTVRDVFGGIGDFIGAAFSAALGVIRGPINGIIGLVNSAIRGINSLSVTIPDWVPAVGGQTWGLSIPSIPMLAKGGNIWREGSVMVGERGPEILNIPAGASVHPLTGDQKRSGVGGDALIAGDLIINEAEDPLGSAGRLAAELRKWGKK